MVFILMLERNARLFKIFLLLIQQRFLIIIIVIVNITIRKLKVHAQ